MSTILDDNGSEFVKITRTQGKYVKTVDMNRFKLTPVCAPDHNNVIKNMFLSVCHNEQSLGNGIAYTKDGKLYTDGNQPTISFAHGYDQYIQDTVYHCDKDIPAYTSKDIKGYFRHGLLHREGDQPAYIDLNQGVIYAKDGLIHRDGDNPAIIHNNGAFMYYKHGILHRDGDNPAVIGANGVRIYYKNGNIHRDSDHPAGYGKDGSVYYSKNGFLHRDGDQPAIIDKGDNTEYFYTNGRAYKAKYSNGTIAFYKTTDELYDNGEVIYPQQYKFYKTMESFPDGTHKFYNDKGYLHSIGDKPALIDGKDGSQHWYYNGMRHRYADKPAIIYSNGHKVYYEFGKLNKTKTLVNFMC